MCLHSERMLFILEQKRGKDLVHLPHLRLEVRRQELLRALRVSVARSPADPAIQRLWACLRKMVLQQRKLRKGRSLNSYNFGGHRSGGHHQVSTPTPWRRDPSSSSDVGSPSPVWRGCSWHLAAQPSVVPTRICRMARAARPPGLEQSAVW